MLPTDFVTQYPALYFAILAFGFVFDHFTRPLNRTATWGVYGAMYALVIGMFVLFSPISFGMVGPSSQWAHLKWLSTWRMAD